MSDTDAAAAAHETRLEEFQNVLDDLNSAIQKTESAVQSRRRTAADLIEKLRTDVRPAVYRLRGQAIEAGVLQEVESNIKTLVERFTVIENAADFYCEFNDADDATYVRAFVLSAMYPVRHIRNPPELTAPQKATGFVNALSGDIRAEPLGYDHTKTVFYLRENSTKPPTVQIARLRPDGGVIAPRETANQAFHGPNVTTCTRVGPYDPRVGPLGNFLAADDPERKEMAAKAACKMLLKTLPDDLAKSAQTINLEPDAYDGGVHREADQDWCPEGMDPYSVLVQRRETETFVRAMATIAAHVALYPEYMRHLDAKAAEMAPTAPERVPDKRFDEVAARLDGAENPFYTDMLKPALDAAKERNMLHTPSVYFKVMCKLTNFVSQYLATSVNCKRSVVGGRYNKMSLAEYQRMVADPRAYYKCDDDKVIGALMGEGFDSAPNGEENEVKKPYAQRYTPIRFSTVEGADIMPEQVRLYSGGTVIITYGLKLRVVKTSMAAGVFVDRDIESVVILNEGEPKKKVTDTADQAVRATNFAAIAEAARMTRMTAGVKRSADAGAGAKAGASVGASVKTEPPAKRHQTTAARGGPDDSDFSGSDSD